MTYLVPRRQKMRSGLLPEAKRVVLPAGIVSTGAPAIINTAAVVGLGLDPWQKDIHRIIWAKLESGAYASDNIGMSIPRQAGKTYLVAAGVFAKCLQAPDVTVVWTAHHNKLMLETHSSLKALVRNNPKLRYHVSRTPSGAEYRAIEFCNGSRIVMAAREHGALRGVPNVSVLVLDEAQILSSSAMDDILPTQNQASLPLTIMMGTPPKPKNPSEAWRAFRMRAINAEKAGKYLEAEAWIEFSADDDAETDDLSQLKQANPSYPKRTPLRAIRKLRRLLVEDSFRREALGIWDSTATPQVIPTEVWDNCVDPKSKPVKKLVLAVDVAPSRDRAAVAVAGLRSDDKVHVELYDQREDMAWLVDWLVDKYKNNPISAVVIDAKSPAASLISDLRKKRVRVSVTNVDGMTNACAQFYDAAHSGKLVHTGQPQLTKSLNSARKREVGDRWAWNRKTTDSDITPIVAATLAHGGVLNPKIREKIHDESELNRRRRAMW